MPIGSELDDDGFNIKELEAAGEASLIDNGFNIKELEAAEKESLREEKERESKINKLKKLVEFNNLELIETNNEGDCMYDAIAKQINDVEDFSVDRKYGGLVTQGDVREKAADWLASNKEKIEGFTEHRMKSWDKYVADVRSTTKKVWGDHLTLKAIANAYDRPIEVYSSIQEPNASSPFIIIKSSKLGFASPNKQAFIVGHIAEFHYYGVKKKTKINDEYITLSVDFNNEIDTLKNEAEANFSKLKKIPNLDKSDLHIIYSNNDLLKSYNEIIKKLNECNTLLNRAVIRSSVSLTDRYFSDGRKLRSSSPALLRPLRISTPDDRMSDVDQQESDPSIWRWGYK